jgi:hypothetical protein
MQVWGILRFNVAVKNDSCEQQISLLYLRIPVVVGYVAIIMEQWQNIT